MKRLAVIDGKSIFYRGYYAMPNLALPDGTPTGGVYGFASIAIELIKKLEPDYVAVAWDKPKTNIRKRRAIYPEYKAGRKPAPPDFYAQVPILLELLDAFGWPFYELDDYEADDIMGTFAKQAEAKGIETYLLTSDLDALQLIAPSTKVYAIKNGFSNLEEFDVDAFEKKYGLEVEQFLDLKSLKGDSSDNIPGVPGIGEKTAITLLQDFKTLDGVYQNLDNIKPSISKKLLAGKDSAYLSKKVGMIWCDAPVTLDWDVADINDTNINKVATILKRLQFYSLEKRLPKHMMTDENKTGVSTSDAENSNIHSLIKKPWPKELQIDGPIFIELEGDSIWISTDAKTVHTCKVVDVDNSFWQATAIAKVVGYDLKDIYHQLDDFNVSVHFRDAHDLRQGAFLIDPLNRDNSKNNLINYDGDNKPVVVAGLAKEYERQLTELEVNKKLLDIALNYDFPLTYTLFQIEKRGFKLDTAQLEKFGKELEANYKDIEQEMYSSAGHEFNIASPAQLSEVLFNQLGLPTDGIKKGKTGYSTSQSELDKLKGKHPIIEQIEQAREIAKLKNTYVDTLPKQVDEASRIHTTFSQDVASTGRLSSSNPNMQNIPIRTDQGKRIRDAFVTDGDKVLVSADYSQFELRLAAILAGDESLINDFNGDVDIHTKTASEVYGVPMDDVTKSQRRDAKVINFGVLYGMSPHGLANNTGMTFTQAKQFIDHYFELRAPIRKYIDQTIEKARRDGYVETFYGRRRPTPDVKSPNYIVRGAAERAAANLPIQGTEADLMKRAMLKIDEAIKGLGEQIMQVHDSIIVECPKENGEKISQILKSTMENIAPELKISLKVDVSIGDNWGQL